jgi:hypothetical protein
MSWLLRTLCVGTLSIAGVFGDQIIYNANPEPLPPNVPGLGYQATQTAEFGELIQFAPGPRNLTTAVVSMSNWALKSTWDPGGSSTGFYHPLTLNLYDVGAGDTVGSLLGSATVNAFIPWRPEADPTCPGGTAYRAGDGQCYNGSLSQVTFNFAGLLAPDQIIYGLAYNTQTWGASPLGVSGPYNSLNFALNTSAPSVGSNPLPDTGYWNTKTAAWYTDGGAAGIGVFRQDTNWTPYEGAITFSATPEPGSIVLLFTVVAGLAVTMRYAGRRTKGRSTPLA